jgi:hypothetical protein
LYKPEYPDLARRACTLGATNDELATLFDVAGSTIDLWLRGHPEFAEAVKKGRLIVDMGVAEKLLSRAMGYTWEGKKYVLHDGEEKEIRHVLHHAPNVQACMFWLRNRRRQHWQERAQPAPESRLSLRELEAASERARPYEDKSDDA